MARADVQAQQAEVERLKELTGFERVVAPFDGVITARNTDVGALINAGAGGPATELFHMTATGTLRMFVAVPEVDFPAMHAGAAATVTLQEYPGEVFHGRLVRTNDAINPASRTLLVEVDVDNAEGKLLPGAYVFVHFTLPGRESRSPSPPTPCCSVARARASVCCATVTRCWCPSPSAATMAIGWKCCPA